MTNNKFYLFFEIYQRFFINTSFYWQPFKLAINNPNSKFLIKTKYQAQFKYLIFILITVLFLMIAFAYGFVPLYRLFCLKTGYGGAVQISDYNSSINGMEENGILNVHFWGEVYSHIPIQFKTEQLNLKVIIGQTSLAFYSIENPTSEVIKGIFTYHILPHKAGLYFNKIQCFCFEQIEIPPYSVMELPVLFFIDPLILADKELSNNNNLLLFYTFFGENSRNSQSKSILFCQEISQFLTNLVTIKD